MREQPKSKGPVRPFRALMGVVQSVTAYVLMAVLLLFTLLILEPIFRVADRFFARRRGNAFYRMQRGLARWFLRLWPFGEQRRVGTAASAFPQPCVIVCNHQSPLDLLLCLQLPVNARWIIGPWVKRVPGVHETSRLAGHVITDDVVDFPPEALEHLKQGICVLAFPEGRPGEKENLGDFHDAAFKLAVEAKVPVTPVVFDGTGACLQPGRFRMTGKAEFHTRVLRPISGDEAGRLKADTHARMAAALAATRGPDTATRGPDTATRGIVNGWLTRLGMGLAGVILAVVTGLSIYVQNFCIAEPPVYAGDRSLADQAVRESRIGGLSVTMLGENWRRRRDGVHELALVGDDWRRGYANARLTPELLERQERRLLEIADEFVPNAAAFWLLKHMIAVNNRRLPEFVLQAESLEILGLTEGSVDHFPGDVPLYHRVLNYHAAHDISHLLIDNPLVARADLIGCSAFAAWGKASEGGELLVARNFDWEAGKVFDQHKCVIYVWPEGGIPYAHVAWAGMAGAVTGMNAQGLSVHLNAARTDEFKWGRVGTPVSMLARRVLESASTIDEAHAIIREARVFVSDSFMVASRDEGRAVVIEKSPDHCVLREAGTPGLLLQTNHLLGEPWRDDKANREQMERATSLYRWQRLDELTRRGYGGINVSECLAILRDRRGMGDKELGLGNRNAIDAGICTHSVIMNVTRGEMWVSAGPQTYGEYVHIPVLRMLQAGPAGALRTRVDEADNLPRHPRFAESMNLPEFRRQVKAARVAADRGRKDELRPVVRNLRNLNPDSFETAYFEGRYALLQGEQAEAARHFERALARDPHYAEVREHIQTWLSRAR